MCPRIDNISFFSVDLLLSRRGYSAVEKRRVKFNESIPLKFIPKDAEQSTTNIQGQSRQRYRSDRSSPTYARTPTISSTFATMDYSEHPLVVDNGTGVRLIDFSSEDTNPSSPLS